ncbi:MAG: hypothetical protein AB7Y46_15370 [Armatimonadota bacterium]
MRRTTLLQLVTFLGCVVVGVTCAGPASPQEAAGLEARLTQIAARFFGVPEELLNVTSVTEDEPGNRPSYGLRAMIVTPEGRPVSSVVAHIDIELGYVTSAGRRVFAVDEALGIAEQFAKSSFPAWSDAMVLQEMTRDKDQLMCRWAEKIGDVWTGNYVALTLSVYRPGVPQVYVAYVATERSPDDAQFTAEQAQEALRSFLSEHDYESDLQPAELHLDDLNWHFPFWWIPYRVRQVGAAADAPWMEGFAGVNAITGEVVEPRLDQQQEQ